MTLKCKNIKLNLVLNKNIDISCIDTSHIEISEKHSSIIWRFKILKSNIKKQGWPTVILFSNSSYVLIGGTCYKKKKKKILL